MVARSAGRSTSRVEWVKLSRMSGRNRHSDSGGRPPIPMAGAAGDTHGGADGTTVSKSERKRRAERLQQLGRRLAELAPERLAELPLSDDLKRAIIEYQRFGSHGARRRQLQFIGRLMRDVDPAPLVAALETLEGHSVAARREFHEVETWRTALLERADALTEFMDAYPGTDVQQLRHHIQHVQRARTEAQQRGAARALFRFLREAVHPA